MHLLAYSYPLDNNNDDNNNRDDDYDDDKDTFDGKDFKHFDIISSFDDDDDDDDGSGDKHQVNRIRVVSS